MIVYENDGSLSFSATSNRFSVSNPVSLSFTDVEPDGDYDLVVEDNQSTTHIYYNDGAGNFE